MRDVTIDEVFTWREELGAKAQEAFGGWLVDASPQTFADLKARCDQKDREIDPFFRRGYGEDGVIPAPTQLNAIRLHMVRAGDVPDGILRGCSCGNRGVKP
jgi:hypothetical protein